MTECYFDNSGIPSDFSIPVGVGGYTSTGTTTVGPSRTEIMDSIKSARELLGCVPKVIEVWKGDNNIMPRPLVPEIHEDTILSDGNACYVAAGVGVVAGIEAFKRLKEQGYIAVWVDEPVDKYN